ncbi:MAG TPA: GH3 auxin-responsive promoter family protein [Verrucomicrobiae bacterium]|nr:GH3 auxin-responsive promoter family protein [Verrucomicrobiae bacterium]
MKPLATIANSLWVGSCFKGWRQYRHALQHPAPVQQDWLKQHLRRHAHSDFGRQHRLGTAVHDYEEFVRRVPLQDYESLEPWLKRIQQGQPNVLTAEPVTHLIPTSGSTQARKLIPFTAGLQRDFDRAIAPWIFDLTRQQPGILGGPAYWSVSPALPAANETSAVPVGFSDDASYLGGVKGWLVRSALVTSNEVLQAGDLDTFQHATLLALLQERELRLISIWHPSFLMLLLKALPTHWDELLATIARHSPIRARELERTNPLQPETLWPRLCVISCWGHAQAESGYAELQQHFPQTHLQRKGLLATEAFITIPFAERHPLALRSHFFEFLDASSRLRRAHELHDGETYEVVVTTSGGLWRYRLGDLVRVTGFVKATPSLQFLGRNSAVSDLCGEKLSEAFVAAAVQRISVSLGSPKFAMLAPETRDVEPPRYTLFFNGAGAPSRWQVQLEAGLRRNPHYDYCRRLGQLAELSVCPVGDDAGEVVLQREASLGKRLGDIKLSCLSKRTDWSEVFTKSARSTKAHRPIQPPSILSTAPLR